MPTLMLYADSDTALGTQLVQVRRFWSHNLFRKPETLVLRKTQAAAYAKTGLRPAQCTCRH